MMATREASGKESLMMWKATSEEVHVVGWQCQQKLQPQRQPTSAPQGDGRHEEEGNVNMLGAKAGHVGNANGLLRGWRRVWQNGCSC